MDLRELNFGVEIETVRRTRKRVAEAIQSVVGGSVTHPGQPGVFDPWEVADEQRRTWLNGLNRLRPSARSKVHLLVRTQRFR